MTIADSTSNSQQPEIKAILMSGYTDELITLHNLSEQIVFLVKPFTPEKLVRRVREVLDQ